MISLRSVCFAHPGGEKLFDDLDLDVAAGETVGLTGASGRGKSTLLYLCGLLLRPDSGEIMVGASSTQGLSDAQRSWLRAHRMGFVFQDAALDPTRTVLENVTEGAVYRGQRRSGIVQEARSLLERYGVELRAEATPTQVSGGQASRIGLCRALVGRPPIVLADEPTGNLDNATSAQVLEGLTEIAGQGAAVVVATHDPDVTARCDRVVDLAPLGAT